MILTKTKCDNSRGQTESPMQCTASSNANYGLTTWTNLFELSRVDGLYIQVDFLESAYLVVASLVSCLS